MDVSIGMAWRLWLLCGLVVFAVPVTAQEEPDHSEELKKQEIEVDESIFQKDWNDVPYDSDYFNYSDEQLRERWTYLSRGLASPKAPVPFPSAEFLREQLERYPQLKETVEDFDGDYAELEARYLDSWRDFFAGNFQQSWRKGKRMGAIGELPALLSQLMYAIYLAERQSVKNMLLQDVINTTDDYFDRYPEYTREAAEDPEVAALIAAMYLVKNYAMARIAEEAPIPVIAARGYIRKIQEGSDKLLEISPGQPLGLAFDAGVGAGIMRRMGKFTGRMTYGARITDVEKSFAGALEKGDDIPIVHYEYANALIYMSRKREINNAIRYMEKAMQIHPTFSMDALDAMYAYKRLQEVRLYALNFRSFRDFDKARREFARETDRNLTSVLTSPLNMDMLNNPEKYRLPEM